MRFEKNYTVRDAESDEIIWSRGCPCCDTDIITLVSCENERDGRRLFDEQWRWDLLNYAMARWAVKQCSGDKDIHNMFEANV
jgi:hypothetical protein